jgi:hypothetical protein
MPESNSYSAAASCSEEPAEIRMGWDRYASRSADIAD